MIAKRRRGSDGPNMVVPVVLLASVIGAVFAWWVLPRRGGEDAPEPVPLAVTDTVVADSSEQATVEPIDLPALSASDAVVRGVVGALSEHPQLAGWLVTDELVHRFVGSVVDLAGGGSPAERLDFMRPEGDFKALESGSALVIDPASYRRYDGLAQTVASLDTDGAARLYHQLHPLFEEAFGELGLTSTTFDDVMERAVQNVVEVDVPGGPIEVTPFRASYEFLDYRLETVSSAEKHLIRMGPENARRLQSKLSAVWQRIGELELRATP